MLLKTILNNYLNFCQLYRRKGTYESYKQSFTLLQKMFDSLKLKKPSQLNDKTYNLMIQWLKDNTIKKNSKINDLMATLKSALNYSNIKYNFKFERLTDDTTHFKSLNDHELQQLLDYLKTLDINDSNNLVWITSIYIMLDTGVRKNELLHIKNHNIDFNQKVIYLDTTKTHKRTVKFGKLSYSLIKVLYDSKNDYLMWNRLQDKPMTAKSLEVFFIKINNALKLSSGNIHPHRLRKTFATQLLKMGCPLPTIQRLLGHSDIKMTMIYLDIDMFLINKDYSIYYPYN